jgi:hypothetical protein
MEWNSWFNCFSASQVSIKKTQRALYWVHGNFGCKQMCMQWVCWVFDCAHRNMVQIQTWKGCAICPNFLPWFVCKKAENGRELTLGKCVQYIQTSSCRLSILLVKQECFHSWCVFPCRDSEPWWCSCVHHGSKSAPKTVFRHAYTHILHLNWSD